MKPLFIILAQSNTGAVLLIVALLLVAALIGYLTAWYYAKSVYTPVIKGLEVEKADLLKQVALLRDDISKLNGRIEKLNEKITRLEDEITEKDKEIKHLSKPKKVT
jgi:peptidoglycan hydrolase CwlO-like protein